MCTSSLISEKRLNTAVKVFDSPASRMPASLRCQELVVVRQLVGAGTIIGVLVCDADVDDLVRSKAFLPPPELAGAVAVVVRRN